MLTNKPSMFNKQANVKSVRKVYVNIENDDVYLIWWGFDEKFEIKSLLNLSALKMNSNHYNGVNKVRFKQKILLENDTFLTMICR